MKRLIKKMSLDTDCDKRLADLEKSIEEIHKQLGEIVEQLKRLDNYQLNRLKTFLRWLRKKEDKNES